MGRADSSSRHRKGKKSADREAGAGSSWLPTIAGLVVIGIAAWGIGTAAGRRSHQTTGGSSPPPANRSQATGSPATELSPTKLSVSGRAASMPLVELGGPRPPTTYAELRDECLRVVQDVVERYPDDPSAHEKAAQLLGVFGEKERAGTHWSRCVELAPRYLNARYALTWFALQDGRYEEMARQAKDALAIDPSSGVFRDLLGCALIEQGDLPESQRVLQESIQLGVATCDTHTLLGKAGMLSRDYELAAKHYQRAVELDPHWSKALYGLAMAYTRSRQPELAKQVLTRFQATRKRDAVMDDDGQLAAAQRDVAAVYRTLANLFARHQDPANAERFAQRSGVLDPTITAAGESTPRHLQGRVSEY